MTGKCTVSKEKLEKRIMEDYTKQEEKALRKVVMLEPRLVVVGIREVGHLKKGIDVAGGKKQIAE